MTKSYKDGIIDCLNIVKIFTDVGVYNSPLGYIKSEMEKLLITPEKNISNNTITNESKKSQEVQDD